MLGVVGVGVDVLDEHGFTALQKAGKQINRNFLHGLHPKQLSDAVFVQLCANDAQAAGVVSRAAADFGLTGYEVEVNPLAFGCSNDALGAQDGAQRDITECVQDRRDLLLGVLVRGLTTPALEDLVGMVVTMMIVVVAAAGASFAVLVVVFMLMVVVMVFMFVLVVMAAAGAVLTVLMVVFVVMLMVMMLMVMVMAAAFLTVFMVMFVVVMMVVLMLLGRMYDLGQYLSRQRVAVLHDRQ